VASNGVDDDSLAAMKKMTGEIEVCLDAVRRSTRRLAELTQETAVALPDDVQEISSQIQREIKAAQAQALKGKKALEKLRAARDDAKLNSQKYVIFDAQYKRASGDYVSAVREHQLAKEHLRKTEIDIGTRRGLIIYGETKNEEQIRKMLDENPQQFMRDAILEESGSAEAQAARFEAETRARDVAELMKSLREVSDMVQDVAILIAQQTETIDKIETHVEITMDNVEKGNDQLRKAVQRRKRMRKCYCCMLCAAIVSAAILAGALGIFFSGAYKSF